MRKKVKGQKAEGKVLVVKVFLLITGYLLLVTGLPAQTFSVTLDREKILLGEQVTLQLASDSVNLAEENITQWPSLQDTFNHIEIVKRSPVDTINVGGYISYRQNFIITSFDSGTWLLPKFTITLQKKIDSADIALASTQAALQVLPVDVSALQQYHPIKDVIDVDVPFNWVKALIILVIFFAALAVGIYLTKRRKKAPKEIKLPVTANRYTMEAAIEKLQQLNISNAATAEQRKAFHTEMDAVCRNYFEDVLNISALRATDVEIENRLSVFTQNAERKQLLKDILDANRAVKFAKFVPSTHTSNEVRKDAIQLIRELDDVIRQTKRYAGTMVSKY